MQKKIKALIQRENLIQKGDKVLVGVSGGADSVCLFDILYNLCDELSFSLTVVHINHMIRGAEADADEAYVRKLCSGRGVEFHSFCVDVPQKAEKLGISSEEAGRMARYEIFNSLDADKIAVAHHMNDQAETVLHHIFRGSSIGGVGGMDYSNGKIIRPLLDVSRNEIEKYLDERKIDFCIDSTNLENDYTRNKLRNVLIPYVKENFNSNIVHTLCELAQDARETDAFIHSYAQKVFDEVCSIPSDDAQRIIISKKLLSDNAQVIVREVLMMAMQRVSHKQKDITRAHVESLKKLLEGPVSKTVSLPYKMRAFAGYDAITIERTYENDSNSESVQRDYEINMEVMPYEQNWEKISNDYTKVFDYDKIKNNIVIRKRMPGDYIIFDEAGHRKLLKEYFINEKVPRSVREELPLVCDGSHVMWIVGYRMSAAYKADRTTKRILVVTVRRNRDGIRDKSSD